MIALGLLGGCASVIILSLLFVGGLLAGGNFLWEKTLIEEPLTEAENATILHITNSLKDVAGEDATVSVKSRNKEHSNPKLSIDVTAREPVDKARGRAIVTGIDKELRASTPKKWKISHQDYSFKSWGERSIDIVSNGHLGKDIEELLDLAFAAPRSADWIRIEGDRSEVKWYKMKDSTCTNYFKDSKSTIESSSTLPNSPTLELRLVECGGEKSKGNFLWSVTAKPEEAPQAISWLLDLQPKLKGRGITGARVYGDGELVLLPENYRKKDEPHPKPQDFKDVWPHGKITIADNNMIER